MKKIIALFLCTLTAATHPFVGENADE